MNAVDTFNDLLHETVLKGASDLHLTTGQAPALRIHGQLQALARDAITQPFMTLLLENITTASQLSMFERHKHLDLSYRCPHDERYRVNFYREMAGVAVAVRHLDQSERDLESLRLPEALKGLAELRSGLVLVTGATGSGKSTTLAAMIDHINRTRPCHIVTVEDPIEFVHQPVQALIHHRELHTDVNSVAEAIVAAMRADPDVILVGEMRDVDTVRAALTAAETGHLVFSTLHTGDAIGAIERLVGSFPTLEQAEARHRLGMVLRAVAAQRLVPTPDNRGRVPAVELLIATPAIANLIETSRSRQITALMESGASLGMQTLDQALVGLVRRRLIRSRDALALCNDRESTEKMLQNGRPAIEALRNGR
ncbi:MAG: PilT/PilU family type 4a pilus ATPase [Pseudomonadota bacterium]